MHVARERSSLWHLYRVTTRDRLFPVPNKSQNFDYTAVSQHRGRMSPASTGRAEWVSLLPNPIENYYKLSLPGGTMEFGYLDVHRVIQ